jgi:hypothetical protein
VSTIQLQFKMKKFQMAQGRLILASNTLEAQLGHVHAPQNVCSLEKLVPALKSARATRRQVELFLCPGGGSEAELVQCFAI